MEYTAQTETTDYTEEKLFNNPVLEKLSHTNSFLVISTLTIISLLILIYGLTTINNSWAEIILFPISGWLTFTLIEYCFHRFLYHSGEDYKKSENWQYKIHGVHHKKPRQKDRLSMPLVLALILSSAFFGLFYLILQENTYLFFPGFLIGYSAYLTIHYLMHTISRPKLFGKLWKHHNLHHYKYEEKAFGVSSRIWDRIFRTMPPE